MYSVSDSSVSVLAGDLWHLPDPWFGRVLLHRARISRGLVPSLSSERPSSDSERFEDAYAPVTESSERESVWEAARAKIAKDRPSRRGAFFLYASEADAKFAQTSLFARERRHLIRARIVKGAKIFAADSRWLSDRRQDWADNAVRYWKGERTEEPLLEVIVDGLVYFPDWQSQPFSVSVQLP